MYKRIFTLMLGVVLVFGVMTPVVMAAEANFQYDVLGPEFSIRGEQGPLLVEVPFAEKDWYDDGNSNPVWGLSGFNIGVKGPGLSPFYAKLQFNWLRTTNNDQVDKYYFDGPEVGVGGVYDLWNYTSFGAELSVKNPSLTDISSNDPSLEVFIKYKFDNFLGLTEPEPST